MGDTCQKAIRQTPKDSDLKIGWSVIPYLVFGIKAEGRKLMEKNSPKDIVDCPVLVAVFLGAHFHR